MSEINIKQATAIDLEVLVKIGRETFAETFSSENSQQDLENYLNTSFTNEKLLSEIAHPSSQFYIAWNENTPIGYLKINTDSSQTEDQGNEGLEIERIYVKQDYQGQKIGHLLYNQAVTLAKSMEKTFVWLGVWELNIKAIKFYERQGFEKFSTHIFRIGSDEQTDWLMKKMI